MAVAVAATARPRPDVRFLCDEMLGRLGRYLRAAGYDTAIASGGAPDRDLLAAARREGRRLLTCDRGIADHKAARDVALILPRGDLDRTAAALTAALHVDWLHAAFSRCLVDNALLVGVHADDRARVPADVRALEARRCPACGRVYWAGSHHRRMRRRLLAWADGEFGAPEPDGRSAGPSL